MCPPNAYWIIEEEDVRLARAITFSSYALLLWDYLLTLDDEITYIWKSPCSIVKCFFLGNRYLNLIVQPINIAQIAGVLPLNSKEACFIYYLVLALYQFWSYGSVHVLVLLRVWILNGRSRKITIALGVITALYIFASIALLAYTFYSISFDFGKGVSAGSCGGRLAAFSWLIWIIESVLEVFLFVFMILTLRRQQCAFKLSRVPYLVRSLYIHAVIFFLANTLGDIMNTVAWTVFLRGPLHHIPNTFPIALVNITGQRLAIDLRRLHVRKEVTASEVSREVELQLAVFELDDPALP